jgi:hypothetical protein
MIRLANGTYVSNINGSTINLFYRGNNRCDIYVNGTFQGNFLFNEAKAEINIVERGHQSWNNELIKKYQFPEFQDNDFPMRR